MSNEATNRAQDMVWKFGDAIDKFSEVVRLALDGEPQRIERHEDTVVVVNARVFDRLTADRKDFISYLSEGPDLSELKLGRDASPMRHVDL